MHNSPILSLLLRSGLLGQFTSPAHVQIGEHSYEVSQLITPMDRITMLNSYALTGLFEPVSITFTLIP